VGELALLLRAVADKNRLRLVELLSRRELCVTAAAQELELSQPLVSQHLRVLRQAGLIRGERRGRRVHYRVDRERWEELLRELQGLVGLGRPGRTRRASQTSRGRALREEEE